MKKLWLFGLAAMPLGGCLHGYAPDMEADIRPPQSLEPAASTVEPVHDDLTPASTLMAGGSAAPVVRQPGLSLGDSLVLEEQANVLWSYRTLLDEAEEARLAGDCERRLDIYDELANLQIKSAKLIPPRTQAEFDIRQREEAARDCPPGTASIDLNADAGSSLMVLGGAGKTELTSTGIGFQRESGGEERFAGETADELDTERIAVEGFFRFDWGTFGLGLEHGWGDGRTSSEVPASAGIDTGIVYGMLSPAGSSGVSIGDRGAQTQTRSDFDYWHLKTKAFLPIGRAGLRPFVYADYLRTEVRHDMSYFYEGVGGGYVYRVEQDRVQTIEDQALGLGVGILLTKRLSNRWRTHALGSVGGLFRESELSSREHNRANFGPVSDQDFVIERQRSDDGFGATGTLAVGLEYALSPRLSLGFGAHITTLEEVGAVYNPRSGDEVFLEGREVDLTSGQATTWGGQVAFRYRFGTAPGLWP